MTDQPQRLPRSFWIGISLLSGFIGLALFVAIISSHGSRSTPIPVLGRVADFTLTNQDEKITTLAELTNHVWVADIIFTRCGGPCPRMTGQMKSLQDSLSADNDVKLVTLTTDPDFDSPAVMKRYGEHFNADFNRWTFLTGKKSEIAGLGGDSLKLTSVPVKPEDRKDNADLFIHSTIFVAVDKHAQLRGVFETGGDGVDWTNVLRPQLLETVRQLENEP